jgi:hypothetical protein
MAPVELHERVDEIPSHRPCAENLGELREVEQPVGVPGGPVRIVPVRDPVDHVVGLSRLIQEIRNSVTRSSMVPATLQSASLFGKASAELEQAFADAVSCQRLRAES